MINILQAKIKTMKELLRARIQNKGKLTETEKMDRKGAAKER